MDGGRKERGKGEGGGGVDEKKDERRWRQGSERDKSDREGKQGMLCCNQIQYLL